MRLSPRKDKYYMNNEVVRVLVTSPLGVGGVTNMMIHIQEHLDRSKINFDYLVFHDRHEPMEDKVLSPLNEQSSVHYYYLLDSIDYWKEGEVYKIRVIPRYRSTQLLEGFFWITTNDWTIRYLNFHGAYDLIRFHVAMRMGETEKTKYLPQLINLDIVFKFLRNNLEMNYTGWLKYDEVIFKKKKKWMYC